MENLQTEICSAENKYLDRLESFFNSKYPRDKLISHGIEHHRRVWEFAKELVIYMKGDGFIFDRTFIQKLIIACYLHDIGMSVDTGIKHGHHSRKICVRFLKQNDMKESDNQDLLAAIQNHDNKAYETPPDNNMLATILNAADDLDAFGKTGIMRYKEIYKLRGIEQDKIGYAVYENAVNRFRNFEKTFSGHPDLVDKHRKRFKYLIDNISCNAPK